MRDADPVRQLNVHFVALVEMNYLLWNYYGIIIDRFIIHIKESAIKTQ